MNVVRIILLPFSWLYGLVIRIRNVCYDASIFTVHKINVPVLSVGNLTAGGTGKTPFVEYLVRYLSARGKKAAVISRGYKRTTEGLFVVSDGVTLQGTVDQSGDEPFQIAKKFPWIVVIVDEKRARAAQYAIEHYAVDGIILDDGFQHRSLYRNLDIVMIDGATVLRDIPMLPAGLRREPLSSLKRAGLLAASGVSDRKNVPGEFGDITSAPVISVTQKVSRIVEFSSSKSVSFEMVKGQSCLAFCGIGNPQSFRSTLAGMGLNVIECISYPDHHRYSTEDLKNIEKRFSESQAKFIVTTEKDAVRFSRADTHPYKFVQVLRYLEIETAVPEGEEILHRQIDAVFNVKK